MTAPQLDESKKTKLQGILNILAKGTLTTVVVALILGTFLLAGIDRMVAQLELKTYDLRAQMQWGEVTKRPSPDIIILQFDDSSLNVLNDEFGVWPWPRDVHARMIHFLNRIGARSLIYDIMFVAHRKGSEDADQKLIDAFKQYHNVFLSMNFDNELLQNQKLGKDFVPKDIERLLPLAVEVRSELNQASANTMLKLERNKSDGSIFFDNDHISFNHYRSIMDDLLMSGRNIGIINHGADVDGVSRSNPLLFRFQYQPFIQTSQRPLVLRDGHWYDQGGNRTDADGYLFAKTQFLPVTKLKEGHYEDRNPTEPKRVDAEGYLLDDYGNLIYAREQRFEYKYFPYLGLRAVLDMKFPHQKPVLTLTKEGRLQFTGYDIPLDESGNFLVNWYNVNIKRDEYTKSLRDLKAYHTYLTQKIDEAEKHGEENPKTAILAKELRQIKIKQQKTESVIKLLEGALNSKYVPQPYKMISAWEVIRTMKKEEAGLPLTEEDEALKHLLKNKIIFIGATAVGAYDIKNTSIYPTMPGVVLQANLFDNLYQNDKRYLQRVPPYVNFSLTLLICLLAAWGSFKMRSPLAGVLTTANISVLYVLFTIIMYQSQHLWVNVAMPMVCLVITITVTFMLKYFFRNQDYEKTYALATTDSMTNLYNHRFFQDHMRRSVDQANRFKHKFSLLLIDIDFFKKFNDTYGHQAGDEVLRQVAKKLKKNVRNVDVVARYGGEEMAIILDRANEEEALAVAEKIVKAVAEEAYPIAEGVAKHVTISCGVATYPTHGETPSALIEFSDAGLYRAKENGRNQVGAQYSSEQTETEPVPPEGGLIDISQTENSSETSVKSTEPTTDAQH